MPRAPKSFGNMSEEQLRELEQRTAMYYQQGREPSTTANLDRYRRYYAELTTSRGKEPWPADPFDVACFLSAYCDSIQSVQSLDNAHSALRTGQRELCSVEWTKPQEAYMAMVKRGLRKKYRRPVHRKRPITLDVLVDLIRELDVTQVNNLQYAAMMFLAHDACLRLKELLALRWSDIEWILDADGEPTGLKVVIRVSKARYEEAAETLELASYDVEGMSLSAIRWLCVYMHEEAVLKRQGGVEEAFLFPNVRATTAQTPVPRETFVEWVKARLLSAGYTTTEFGGHSFRAGGATDLHTGKAPEVIARMLGRWRSREAYLIYIRLDPSKRAADVSEAYTEAYRFSIACRDACNEAMGLGDLEAGEYVAAYEAEFQ